MMQDSSSNVQQNETINLLQSTLQSISVIQYPVVLPSMIDPLQSPSKILELSLLQLCTISDTSDCFLITICCVSIVIKLLFRHQNIKTTRNYSDEIIKYSSHLSLIRSQFLYFFQKLLIRFRQMRTSGQNRQVEIPMVSRLNTCRAGEQLKFDPCA